MEIDVVRDLVQERARAVKELTARFLATITTHIDSVPFGLRWLCKVIRNKCLARFPDVGSEGVGSLVGGFFLLRYINPAIISPEAFGIVHKKPSPTVRASLTQVAKILQTVANSASSVRGGTAAVLGDFLAEQRGKLATFLNELCEVGDFDEDQRLENIFALASIAHTISITPNEVYAVHSLLQKYADKLQLQDDDDLHILLRELGDPPMKLSREQNTLVELRLCSRWGPRHSDAQSHGDNSLDDEIGRWAGEPGRVGRREINRRWNHEGRHSCAAASAIDITLDMVRRTEKELSRTKAAYERYIRDKLTGMAKGNHSFMGRLIDFPCVVQFY